MLYVKKLNISWRLECKLISKSLTPFLPKINENQSLPNARQITQLWDLFEDMQA